MEKVEHSSLLKTAKDGRIKLPEFRIQTFVPSSGRGNSEFRISINTLLVIFIIVLAAFLRLYRIQDYMTFLGDEGRDALVVYNILHGTPTLLGPTASVGGFFLGPIYYYFMAPFLWVFDYNPVGPAVMVALFGIATVWLVFKVGSEFLGNGAGLIAAFLYSISPLIIAYSRSSWNPNLMPFFSLLSLYVLYKAISKNSIRLFILCGVLLGISMQLHYLAIFLGVIIVVYVLTIRIFAKSWNLVQGSTLTRISKDYVYLFLGFIMGWSLFLAFEIRHGFPNVVSILSFIFNSGDIRSNNHFFGSLYNVFFRLFARLVGNFPPPEQVALGAHPNIALWYYAILALSIATILTFLFKCRRTFRERSSNFSKLALLLLWLVFGVGLFGFYKKPIYDYYLGFMFPLPFMLVGNMLVVLYTNLHEYARYIVGFFTMSLLNRGRHEFTRIRLMGKVLAVGVFTSLVWINLQGIPFRFPPNRQVAQVEEIAKFVINKTENKPFNFALITSGNSDHAYRYFFTLWGKSPLTIENTQIDPKRKTVTDQLLVVCESLPCHPLGYSLWEVAGFGRAEIVGEWDVSVVKVYKLRHYKGK